MLKETDRLRLIDSIRITPFDISINKSDNYLLHLPQGGKMQISKDLSLLLNLLDGNNTISDVANELTQHFKREVNEVDIIKFIQERVIPLNIIENHYIDDDRANNSKNKDHDLLKLRYRIPLLSKKQLLPITNIGRLLFIKPIILLMTIIIVAINIIVIYKLLMSSQVVSFSLSNFTLKEYLSISFFLYLSIVIHELGHISACHYYNVKYNHLGFGIYLYFPTAYVDITNAWELPRMKRVVVDLGGIYFQGLCTLILFIIHLFYKSPIFLYSIVVINISILHNLNPFFKFDGYWALSDLFGIPNLHKYTNRIIKSLISSNKKEKAGNNTLKSKQGLLFISIYSLFFISYISYFCWINFTVLPPTIVDYPQSVNSLLAILSNIKRLDSIKPLFAQLFNLLFSTMYIIGVALMLYSLISIFAKKGYQYLNSRKR